MKNQRINKLFAAALLALILSIWVAGCNWSNNAQSSTRSVAHSAQGSPHGGLDWDFTYEGEAPIVVLTTTGMIHDIVQNIGGARVRSQALMGAGVDPHLYKASPGDVRKLSEAKMVFYNGLHLEGKMVEILERLGDSRPSVAVASRIAPDQLLKADGTTDLPDPHIWFDVSKWIAASQVVRDALKKFDAANAKTYDANAANYQAQLRVLDGYAKSQLATVPPAQRVLVTAHDAFRYFGRAYDVEVQGLQGISTASEVSVRDVQRIVQTLTSRKIKAIFVESSVPTRSVEAVVQGCRAKGHQVKVGGSLFSDAMGKSGTPTGTYDGMVRHNIDTIVRALK
ncbi:MAG TPA: zinc ABC transporter substrate-binding protein [Abditibacteriaceae bacterium]|nr:zinc ABC transporter substrate-binding protein [Abditibacteriaceae bacterium]